MSGRSLRNAAPTAVATWTDSDVVQLASLWLAGLTIPEVAAAMGRSPSAVASKASRIGLPRREHERQKALANPLEAPPPPPIPVPEPEIEDDPLPPRVAAMRRCLSCGCNFWSPHAGVRRCQKCEQRLDDIHYPEHRIIF